VVTPPTSSGAGAASAVHWVLLAYRVPREPSTPRIAVWRRLKRLGVAQVVDGMVALPADARTVEALEWVAEDVLEAGGTASLWTAELTSKAAERRVIATMTAARSSEYDALADRATTALATLEAEGPAAGTRRLRTLRRELRAITRRDFFPPPQRHRADAAVKAYAGHLATTKAADLLAVDRSSGGVGTP
jgi:hypothetical protein